MTTDTNVCVSRYFWDELFLLNSLQIRHRWDDGTAAAAADDDDDDDDDDNDDDDYFYIALFSALEQTHCARM